jgi:hypothetical protein
MHWDGDPGPLDVVSVSSKGLGGAWAAIVSPGWLMGMTASNSSAATAAIADVFDGADANGEYLFTIALGPNSMTRQSPGLPGVPLDSGIFVQVTAGTLNLMFTAARAR